MNAGPYSPLGVMLVECKTMNVENLPTTAVWELLVTPAIDEASIGLDAVTAEQAEDVIALMIRSVTTLSMNQVNKRPLTTHRTYSALADLIASAVSQGRLAAMPERYKKIIRELAQTASRSHIELRRSMLDYTMRHVWSSQITPNVETQKETV